MSYRVLALIREDMHHEGHEEHEGQLVWRSHPVMEEPRWRSLLLSVTILGISAAVGLSFGGWVYGLLSFGLLGGALLRYYVPTRYTLDDTGVGGSYLGAGRRLPWDRIRRARVDSRGVFLSPFDQPSRLDSYRGVFLRFSGNRDEVMRIVRHYLPDCTL